MPYMGGALENHEAPLLKGHCSQSEYSPAFFRYILYTYALLKKSYLYPVVSVLENGQLSWHDLGPLLRDEILVRKLKKMCVCVLRPPPVLRLSCVFPPLSAGSSRCL